MLAGKGNITSNAEYNFYADPEAANVVLHELGCRISLIPWELCVDNSLPWVRNYRTLGEGKLIMGPPHPQFYRGGGDGPIALYLRLYCLIYDNQIYIRLY